MNKEYYNKFRLAVENILPLLTEAFVDFYGNKYKNIIMKKIESIHFIYVDENSNFCFNIDEKPVYRKLIKEIIKNEECFDGGVISKELPPIVVLKVTNPISLHILIHEINHVLHMNKGLIKKELYPQFVYTYETTIVGFTDNTNDYFYEIINEYMTYRILENVKYYIFNELFSTTFRKSSYILYDYIARYLIHDFYIDKELTIKEKLITGMGNDFIIKFGYFDYLEINELFKDIKTDFIEYFCILQNLKINQGKSDEQVLKSTINILSKKYKYSKDKYDSSKNIG